MSDQILSQEEIDALLSSMDKGEVDLESDKKSESHAVSYDLTSQGRMLRDQFSALDEVYDKFTTSLQKSLSSSLQRPMEVDFISMEMRRFEEFLKAFSHPTSFNIFNMEPLIGSALLVIEANLVFSLIDCMFGGDGKPLSQVREFTLIEQRLMRKFAVEVLRNLEDAWKVICPLNCVLKKTETKPEFIHVFAPNDLVIVVVFSMISGEITGNIHLCIPFLMLESIKDKLSSNYLREAELENTWSTQLQELLLGTTVGINAELGRTSVYTVRDLMDLQEGDVIKFSTGPNGSVTVAVEGIPFYLGLPGVRNGNRAVQISALLRQSRGKSKNG